MSSELFRAFTTPEMIAFSLVVNVGMFASAVLLGEGVRRVWRAQPVAEVPPPVTAAERMLAALCVLLNSAVMLVGWLLFRANIIRIDDSASIIRWLSDAAALLLVMDAAMYVLHRAAHHPIAFRLVHGIHHRYVYPRPLTLFVLHPLEVLGFGGLWLLVLMPHAFSLGGIFLYLTANILFGMLGHVGVEPFPRALARSMLGSSTFHADHHQQPTTNYGFYTGIWDHLFRTRADKGL